MKYSNTGSNFGGRSLLFVFLFLCSAFTNDNSGLTASVPPDPASYPMGPLKTELHEDVLMVTFDSSIAMRISIRTVSLVPITRVSFFAWGEKEGFALTAMTKVTDTGYFNATTKKYKQYWETRISLRPGDNIFKFTAYDKNWEPGRNHMEHEATITSRNYTYAQMMREVALYRLSHVGHAPPQPAGGSARPPVTDCCVGGQDWYDLRHQMIDRILEMKAPLPVPDDAKAEYYDGADDISDTLGKTHAGYYGPLAHLNKANALAPWWPQVYYELGLANELAGLYENAKENFELYMLFQPTGTQAAVAMNGIARINAILDAQHSPKAK